MQSGIVGELLLPLEALLLEVEVEEEEESPLARVVAALVAEFTTDTIDEVTDEVNDFVKSKIICCCLEQFKRLILAL